MLKFKKLMASLRPANRELQYMEVKALSEIMERAEASAAACRLAYQTACAEYLGQCQARRDTLAV